MNTVYLFAIGFLVYVSNATLSYSKGLKASPYYYTIGIILAVIANLTWLYISKLETEPNKLLLKGLYWDIMLTVAYLIVPILFYHARLSAQQTVGAILVLVGITLLH